MLFTQALSLLFGLSTLASAAMIERQATTPSASASAPSGSTVQIITQSIFPGGVASGTSRIESTLPLPCIDGCWRFTATYFYCFLGNTFINGTSVNRDTICPYMCNQTYTEGTTNQTYYQGLTSCLNCIVANGGERQTSTISRATTSTSTSSSTVTGSRTTIGELTSNPNGPIDLNQANGWLKNVTDYCSPRGVNLGGGTTVTAIPTTTGPYSTSWTSGQTINRTQWTGLTQYSPPVATYTQTIGTQYAISGPPGSSGVGSGSGASGAAASQSSRAAGSSALGEPKWVLGGALLAWAVL